MFLFTFISQGDSQLHCLEAILKPTDLECETVGGSETVLSRDVVPAFKDIVLVHFLLL